MDHRRRPWGRYGVYGTKGVHTPHLDALASDGALYTRAYTTASICAPSRSSLLTGVYPHQVDAEGMRSLVRKPLPEGIEVFTEYLRDAGYSVGLCNNGKKDWGFAMPKKDPYDTDDWGLLSGKTIDPTFVPGVRKNEFVSALDLAPTFVSLAGAKVPGHMQGRIFLGPGIQPAPEFLFAVRDRMGTVVDRVRGVFSDRFKYIRNDIRGLTPYETSHHNVAASKVGLKLFKEGKLSGVHAAFYEEKGRGRVYNFPGRHSGMGIAGKSTTGHRRRRTDLAMRFLRGRNALERNCAIPTSYGIACALGPGLPKPHGLTRPKTKVSGLPGQGRLLGGLRKSMSSDAWESDRWLRAWFGFVVRKEWAKGFGDGDHGCERGFKVEGLIGIGSENRSEFWFDASSEDLDAGCRQPITGRFFSHLLRGQFQKRLTESSAGSVKSRFSLKRLKVT